MRSEQIVLTTRDLGYAYGPGQYAIRHLSVDLRRGEILGLLGRNGAGKTTTVRLLTTVLPPTEGGATILGYDLRTGGRALRSRLGVVLQSESLDFVSVERNLTLYAFLWGLPRELAKSRAEEMIELFELGAARKRKPWALSGGERRRFQVARELMHDMDILFLDEPTVGLDAIARRRILRYLKDRARTGLSIVFTTHILHEADSLCDRIAVLHLGRLIALDTPEDLKRKHGGARDVSLTFGSLLEPAHRGELMAELTRRGATVLFLPPEAPVNDYRVSFRAREAEALLPWIGHWSDSHGLRLERMSVEEVTLESAFLGMVGAADDAEGEGADGASGSREPVPSGRGGGSP